MKTKESASSAGLSLLEGVRLSTLTLAGCYAIAIISVLAELLIPLTAGQVVARAQASELVPLSIVLVVLLALLVACVLSGLSTWILGVVTALELSRLRMTVLTQIVRLPASVIDESGLKKTVMLYELDVDRAEPLLTKDRVQRQVSLLMIVGCLALMCYFEWRLLVAVMTCLLLAGVVLGLVLKPLRAQGNRGVEAQTDTIVELSEFVRVSRTAKVYGLEGKYIARFRSYLTSMRQIEVKFAVAQSLVNMITKLTVQIGLLAAVAIGAVLVTRGQTDWASLSGFLVSMIILAGPLTEYGQLEGYSRPAGSSAVNGVSA